MKKVVSKEQVAHFWANQIQDEARTSNGSFYFDGDTIYSYGGHFPIATHFNGIILFTLRKYSVTTSAHISLTHSASSHKEKLYCAHPDEAKRGIHTGNIAFWINQIEGQLQMLPKAKKPEKYLSEIERIKAEMGDYRAFFTIDLTADQKRICDISNKEEYSTLLENRAKDIEDAEKKRIAERKKQITIGKNLYPEYLAAYHSYNERAFRSNLTAYLRTALDAYFYSLNFHTHLRTNGEIVETSKGLNMPVAVAKRYFAFYTRIIKKGGCNGNCNYKMLEYDVTSANEQGLIVGCHSISFDEIQHIATKLNWINETVNN